MHTCYTRALLCNLMKVYLGGWHGPEPGLCAQAASHPQMTLVSPRLLDLTGAPMAHDEDHAARTGKQLQCKPSPGPGALQEKAHCACCLPCINSACRVNLECHLMLPNYKRQLSVGELKSRRLHAFWPAAAFHALHLPSISTCARIA